jgi:hypothetical protein
MTDRYKKIREALAMGPTPGPWTVRYDYVVQAFVGIGVGRDVDEELAGVDEIALGLDGVILGGRDVRVIVCHGSVIDCRVTAGDVVDEVLADEAIEQGAQHVLLEVPTIDGTADVIGNIPDLALQGGALFVACHLENPVLIRGVRLRLDA